MQISPKFHAHVLVVVGMEFHPSRLQIYGFSGPTVPAYCVQNRQNVENNPTTCLSQGCFKKEVDMSVAAPFPLVKPDFSKTEVVKAYVHNIVDLDMDYWKETIEVKKGSQMGRMKTVCFFNPVHTLTTRSWCLTSMG